MQIPDPSSLSSRPSKDLVSRVSSYDNDDFLCDNLPVCLCLSESRGMSVPLSVEHRAWNVHGKHTYSLECKAGYLIGKANARRKCDVGPLFKNNEEFQDNETEALNQLWGSF